jgi:hypothetical protein
MCQGNIQSTMPCMTWMTTTPEELRFYLQFSSDNNGRLGVAEFGGDVLQRRRHFGDVHGRVGDALGIEVVLRLLAVGAVRLGVNRVSGG